MKALPPVMVLLFASAIFAQTLAVSPESASMCPCSTKAFEISLFNDADTGRTYYLSARGSAGAWATLTEEKIDLQPGERKTTFAYLTAPCSAQPGEQTLELKKNYGTQTESQSIGIQVLDCYRLTAEPATQGVTGCRGDIIENNVSVTNLGKYKEIVFLDADNHTSWVEPFAATIQPGEKKSVAIYLNTSAFESATYLLNFSATSSRSPAAAKAQLDYLILNCYNVSIATPERMDVCFGETEDVWVEATNHGLYNESANVILSIDEETPIYNRTITLQPAERRLETFALEPRKKDRETAYAVLQTARSRADSKIDLRALDCNAFSAVLEPQFSFLCPCQSGTAVIRITNLGKHQQNFSITTQGIANISQAVSVEPYGKKDVELQISAGCEARSPQQLNATAANKAYAQAMGRGVNVPPFSACYNTSAEITPATVTLPRGKGEILNVSIRNLGLVDESFAIEPFGGEWILINPQNITLPAGENRTLYLYVNPPATLKPDIYTLGIVAQSAHQLIGGYAKAGVLSEIYTPPTEYQAPPAPDFFVPPASELRLPNRSINQTNESATPTGYLTLGRKNVARTLAAIGILITLILIFFITWKAKKDEAAGETPPEEGGEKKVPDNVTIETETPGAGSNELPQKPPEPSGSEEKQGERRD